MKSSKTWLSFFIPANETAREIISSYLFDLGASGIVEEIDGVRAYFAKQSPDILPALKKYLRSLQKLGHDLQLDRIDIEKILDRDWNAEWKKHYNSLRVGEGILIKPTWEPIAKDAPPCVIEVDPEMAFGTGTHATTQMCLQLLEKSIRGGERIVDIGTGTGILAMAAVKLGAGFVVAFDIDPVATATARRNAAKNNVLDKIYIFTGTLESINPKNKRIDLVVANINRNVIVKMLPLLQKMLDYSVTMILSGILREEEISVIEALESDRFDVLEISYQNEWLACTATKRK